MSLKKRFMSHMDLGVLNFCNKGAQCWFCWTETCSALLYGSEVLCLAVYCVCVSVLFNFKWFWWWWCIVMVSTDIFHNITLLRLKETPRFLKLDFFSETLSFYFSQRQRTLSNFSVSAYPLYFVFFLLHFSCKTVIPEELDFVSCAHMSKNITFATVMVTCISSVMTNL